MATKVFAAESSGSRVYSIGRVGYDSGTTDDGGVYTGTLRSERISPAGDGGLVEFRRVQLRFWHTSSFTVAIKLFVDGTQTQVYNASGTLVAQNISHTESAPTSVGRDGGVETIVPISLNAEGTYIEIEISMDSNNVGGVLLLETIRVGRRIIRPGIQRDAASE